ncbi:MAG: EAL domain-containing protein [Salinarimonas sp.]|nr:EAL domain-containing protein [Salinarimonas sp.]
MAAIHTAGSIADRAHERLDAVAALRAELASPDPYLDNLARVAARACGTKFALISLVGESWQVAAGRFAFPFASLPVSESVCPYTFGANAGDNAVQTGSLLTIPDTTRDPRFAQMALVTGYPHIRFYAGVVITTEDGLALGTLCVLDDSPRPCGLADDQCDILDTLARSVADYFEHTRARMRLRDSENRFRAIAESGSVATWRADRDGRLLEQPGWQDNTGKDIGAALGSGWLDFIHPEDRIRVETLVAAHAGKGEPLVFRYRSYFEPGEYRWVENRATPIFDREGNLKEWAGTVFDIHEETVARDALRLSEERYRALVDMSAALVWRADADGVPQDSLHSSQLSQFDFSPSEWTDNLHPDDREHAMAVWQQAIEDETPLFNLERKRARDGSFRWVQVRGMPLRDTDGHVREWIGIVTDVHDLLAAREALEASEERYRLAAAASSDVIWDFDPEIGRLVWNDAITTLFGYTPPPEGTTVQWWEERVHPQDRARVIRSAEAFISGSDTHWCAEYRFRRADGSYAEVIDQGIRQRSGSAGTLRIVGSIQDLTARNAAQRSVRESEERLRLALNGSRMVAWERLIDSDHTLRSDNAMEVFGVASGSRWLFRDRIHPDDRDRVIAWLEDADRPPGETIEFRFVKPDGETIWLAQRAERPTPDRIIGITWDISDRKAVEAELWQAAHRDSVTGAANRNHFQKEINRVFGHTADVSRALILIDVDAFKEINDTAGHEAGDQLLRAVAAHVQRSVDEIAPGRGFVARIGGDEFGLVLEATAQAEVEALARMLLDSRRLRFTYAGKPIQPSLSLGIVIAARSECDPAELMKDADMALYQAKVDGKGRYVFFDIAMRRKIQARIEICHAVREAAAEGAFIPYYQPKLCLHTNRIIGFEALARWRKEDGNILSPADFAPAFDDHAAMLAIGRGVRCGVTSDIRKWKAAGLATGPIAINLSTAEFSDDQLVTKLMGLLERKSITPDDIEIEVTENVFLGNASGQVQKVLEKLHAIGVSIALDDFGTGFASLTHVRDFPVDRIKIDKRFVRNLLANREDAAIVKALINLGANLGKQVIAEGVETPEQLHRLQELGCNEIQGYVIARPMPAGAVASFLQDRGVRDPR